MSETTVPLPSSTKPMRQPVFWFVLSCGFIFGAVFNLLPVTFPVFRREFAATLEQMGRTQLVFFISALAVGAGGGWAVGHLGLRRALQVSLAALAAGLAAIAAARSFAYVLGGAFLFGMAVSLLVVVCSSLISDYFTELRQSVFSLFGIADAVGAIVGPAALGWWLGRTAEQDGWWRAGYVVSAAIVLALAVCAHFLPRGPVFDPVPAARRESTGSLSLMKKVLSSGALYGIGFATFLHGVAQVGMISWVGQLFQKTHGIGAAEAAYFISVNSAGFFAGRSLLSWIASRRHVSELLVLAVSALGGTLAFVATIFAPSYATALVCFGVAGVFISGDGPSLNSYTGLRFAGRTAMAYALLAGIGNIGGAAGPYLTGLIGTELGLETGIRIIPAFSLALGGLALVWHLRHARRGHAVPEQQ